jgi:hypothetical protein
MITSINKILTEWAYRTRDGLPNSKSMAHQIILEGILREFGWNMEARAELLNNLMEAKARPAPKTPGGTKRFWFWDPEDNIAVPLIDATGKKRKWAYADAKQVAAAKKGKKKKKVYTDKDGDGDVDKIDKRIQDKEELVDSIDDPDEKGEIWSLDKKTKKWTKKKTKLTRRENAEKAIDLKDKMIDAIESGDEDAQKDAVQAMIDSDLFSLNSPGVDTKKLYLGTVGPSARKRVGKDSEKDTGRIDPATGIHYLKFGKNTKLAKAVHAIMDNHGEKLKGDFNKLGDLTGKKRMNPDNSFRNQEGVDGDAPTRVVKIKTINNGNGVVIGKSDTSDGFEMNRVSDDELEVEVARLKKMGIDDKEIKLYRRTVELHNRKVGEFLRSVYNNEELEVFEIMDDKGAPLDPANEKDRQKMPLQITKILKKRYNQLLGKDFRINSPAVGAAMDALETAAENFKNGKDSDGKLFRAAQEEFFEAIDRDPLTRPSVSDVAEILALAEDLSRGRYAVLPSKSNFAVGDVLSVSMNVKNIKGKNKEEIEESLKVLFVTAKGLTSIKYAAGASSQSNNKINGTRYNSTTNAETGKEIKSDEIKKDLMDLSTDSYDELWSYNSKNLNTAKNRTNELQKKYGVKDCPKEPTPFTGKTADADAHKAGYLYADCSKKGTDKRQKAWEKRAEKGMKKIEDCPEMEIAIPKKDASGKDLTGEERLRMARERMVEVYKEQERAGRTMQIVNNTQMESQLWTNRVYETLGKNKAKKLGKKEGDFNKKETNGITVLGGMDFTENPGYDGPCGKPINKMASRITTVKKG